MRSFPYASRAVLAGLLAIASVLSLDAVGASAGVRAFSTTTGVEDTAFVKLDSRSRPSALVPDGRHGLFVVGRLTVGGHARTIVHVLPDGTVDPSFRASIGPGTVFFGAARGNELVLAGRFARIDGGTRHDLAVLDARTGRLSTWVPAMPYGDVRGVAFTPTRLVASVGKTVVAWRDGASEPAWTRRLRSRATIVFWRGSIVAADGDIDAIDPATGTLRTLERDFFFTQFHVISGSLFYDGESTYQAYGTRRTPTCGQTDSSMTSEPLAGTSSTLFVVSAAVDADPPAPPTRIYACTRDDTELPGFTPPSLPMPQQYVGGMAVVGNHLLVFTNRF